MITEITFLLNACQFKTEESYLGLLVGSLENQDGDILRCSFIEAAKTFEMSLFLRGKHKICLCGGFILKELSNVELLLVQNEKIERYFPQIKTCLEQLKVKK